MNTTNHRHLTQSLRLQNLDDMGLSWPRLLSTTSDWSCRPKKRLPSLTWVAPAVNEHSSVGLKPFRIYVAKHTWWPGPGLLNYAKWNRSGAVEEETNVESMSGVTTYGHHNGWMSAGSFLVNVMEVTSQLYEKMKNKWHSAEDTVQQLKMTLQRRDNQVKELGGIIHELHATTTEHQRRIELQRNQLEEQEGMLLEMYVALQMRDNSPHSLVAQELGLRLKHTSKEYWLLRKHRGNLEKVTKPIIQSMIQLSCAAGLISSSIGACAQSCSAQDHDCTNEFYKALQVTVSERPEAFTQFLTILRDNSDSPPCQQLCRKIWKEVVPN